MKIAHRLTLIMCSLAFVSCVSHPPRVKLNTADRIQAVEVMSDQHLYIQQEHLIAQDSLESELSKMKPAWSEKIDQAQTSRNIGMGSFLLQVGTLLGCIGAVEPNTAITWCLTSLAFALPAYLFSEKSQRQIHSVVEEYNKDYPAPQIPDHLLLKEK